MKYCLLVMTFLLALGGVALSACSTNDSGNVQISTGQAFKLKYGQTAALKDADLKIKFSSVISDSRCPQGVTCVWAGEAVCKLEITRSAKTQVINIVQSGTNTQNTQALMDGYQVSFQLSPYPQAGQEINPRDYILTMTLLP